MAVDFKTFASVVDHVTAVRKPVLLRGRHGIGKSTVVYQMPHNKTWKLLSVVLHK